MTQPSNQKARDVLADLLQAKSILENEATTIDRRQATLFEELYVLQNRIRMVETVLLIGRPVQINFKHALADKQAWLNDAVGQLVKVDRMGCTVDYGDIGEVNGGREWRFQFDCIMPAAKTPEELLLNV